eukprot:INCI2684.5.p2 GENE.INCI2684.5~~INCI2684.5.p2  ORF type:complete len:107 (-),score=6.62 INCI2684.5:27-347(-)
MNVSAQIKKNPSTAATTRSRTASNTTRVRRPLPNFENPFNDERNKCPWRTSLMAAFLFTVGVTFLTAGLWKWFNSDDRKGAIAMMTLGSISTFPDLVCRGDHPETI